MRSNMKKKIEHRTLGVGLGREVNTVVIFKYNWQDRLQWEGEIKQRLTESEGLSYGHIWAKSIPRTVAQRQVHVC